jgi:hypothetical protein
MACENFECKASAPGTPRNSVTQGERNLVGWDSAFTENHPGASAGGDIDDGGRDGARRRPPVDDEWDLVAKLLANPVRVGTFGHPEEVRGGCGNGKTEAGDDGSGDCSLRHAQSDIAGIGGDAEGQFGAGTNDKRKRSGPETLGEAVKSGVEPAGELVGLGDIADEQRQRFVAGSRLDLIDAIDGAQIDRIDREAIKGIGRKSYNLTCVETISYLRDELWFGLIGMNTKRIGRQNPEAPVPCAAFWNIGYRWSRSKAMRLIKTA